jgi:hypothetical protein
MVNSRFLAHSIIPALFLLSPYTRGEGGSVSAQVAVFPYTESFDSALPPNLPAGWVSTRNRGTDADMTVSQSASHSAPNCVAATNATVSQSLTSPEFDFTAFMPERVSWFMRRSSTFGAPVVVEYSYDGGAAWAILPGDTLTPDGSASYVESLRSLPRSLGGKPRVRIRWRVIPSSTGSGGTLRFDDISVTVHAARDLSLVKISVSPLSVRPPEPVIVTAEVKNAGLTPAAGFSIALYHNCGDTLHPVPCGLIARSESAPQLGPGDSTAIALSAAGLPGGVNRLVCVLCDTADMNQSDNLLCCEIDVEAPPRSVVINEIMFAPCAGEGEYVEFLNTSGCSVNLGGWQLVAGSGTLATPRTIVFPGVRAPVPPGGFALAAEDSGLFHFFPALRTRDTGSVIIPRVWETRLNNTGMDLVLKDAHGSVVDSVFYTPSWHNPAVINRTGRSLERILPSGDSNDPANWSTCTRPEGGTPAGENSVALTPGPPAGVVSASPNPFSPDGDGVEDATVIRYRIPRGVWSVSVRIFDARGHAIRTLATCAPSTGSGENIWDGRDGERIPARVGIYVVFVEAIDAGRLSSFTAKGVVVLARRRY